MIAEAFFDTNILLYAGSSDPADAAKRSIAQELLLTVPFALSAQMLQECITNALGKKSLGLGESNINALLAALEQVEVLPMTRQLVIHACQLRLRYQLSQWDATIPACRRPFRPAPGSLIYSDWRITSIPHAGLTKKSE